MTGRNSGRLPNSRLAAPPLIQFRSRPSRPGSSAFRSSARLRRLYLNGQRVGFRLPPPPKNYEIAELVLHPGARVNHFVEKAAIVPELDLYHFATPAVDPGDAIQKSDVIDLTGKMTPDGKLDWTPPPGNWVVVR